MLLSLSYTPVELLSYYISASLCCYVAWNLPEASSINSAGSCLFQVNINSHEKEGKHLQSWVQSVECMWTIWWCWTFSPVWLKIVFNLEDLRFCLHVVTYWQPGTIQGFVDGRIEMAALYDNWRPGEIQLSWSDSMEEWNVCVHVWISQTLLRQLSVRPVHVLQFYLEKIGCKIFWNLRVRHVRMRCVSGQLHQFIGRRLCQRQWRCLQSVLILFGSKFNCSERERPVMWWITSGISTLSSTDVAIM